jgi:hypothetical protein
MKHGCTLVPTLLAVDGGRCKFADLLHPCLDCTDEGSEYVNITWDHAGQKHVHFHGKHVPSF